MIEFAYQRAFDAPAAIRLSQADGGKAKFLGGGTNLVDLMREGAEAPTSLVDITRLPSRIDDDRAVGAGLGYGALTYGGADDNLTFGLGYGFVQGDIGSTPVLLLGGQKRISRRVSLVSENYILADSRAGMGGLYGIKINWRRTSLGLGAAYVYSFPYDRTYTYYDYNGVPTTVTERSPSR